MPRTSPQAPLSLLSSSAAAPQWTIGVDEAGRGCLAGPVVAAAVLLPPRYELPGLGDSKALKADARDTLAPAIRRCALAWGLGVSWQGEIDKINILQATFLAMSRALRVLRPASLSSLTSSSPAARPLLLIDGNKTIPDAVLLHTLCTRDPGLALPAQKAVVDGDALEPCISAASILAKTFRDRIMEHLDNRYPQYGFAKHKGYGTKAHLAALQTHGPCPLHRLTFARVLPPVPHTAPAQGSLL